MLKIIITATTENGKEAIRQHFEESKKVKGFVRAQWKFAGFSQAITNKDPYELTVTMNNPKLAKDHFILAMKGEIQEGLLMNGAAWEDDYNLKVVKDE